MSAAILPRNSALPTLIKSPRDFAHTYRVSLVILILGASADVFTTLWNLRSYGPMVEAHLVQRWVSEVVGVEVGVPIAKATQLVFVLFVAAWWRPWCGPLLIACGSLYALAAISNYFLLL